MPDNLRQLLLNTKTESILVFMHILSQIKGIAKLFSSKILEY